MLLRVHYWSLHNNEQLIGYERMPVCEGRADGPCPLQKNDKTVQLSQGDLMLCVACERHRFPECFASSNTKASALKVSVPETRKTNQKHASGATPALPSSDGRSQRPSESSAASSSQDTALSQVQIVSSPARLNNITKVVLSELLSYVSVYRNCSNEEAMMKVVLNYFSHDNIAEAKRLLVQEFHSVAEVTQYLTERRNSSSRPAHEAELDDVMGILDAADTVHALDGYLFAAANLQIMPSYGPEEINLAVVADRQVKMDGAIKLLTSTVQMNSDSLRQQVGQSIAQDLQQKLDCIKDAIGARLEHLSTVCNQLAQSNASYKQAVCTTTATSSQSRDIDRSMNLMVFGVREEKDASVWRGRVDQALAFTAGMSVDVTDMFRVGRFDVNKSRPILVKLRTVWDKRIILSNCHKLRDYPERIFVAPDESLEERRKRMFERIKFRSEKDGKSVVVDKGILLVDNVQVFSLKDGRLSANNG